MKWRASKCLKSSGVCRGRVGRVREASRGLGALEAGPAAGGRRAGSEVRSQRALSHLCCRKERLFYSQDRNSWLPLYNCTSRTQSGKQSQGVYSSSLLGRRVTLSHRQGQHSDPNRHPKGSPAKRGVGGVRVDIHTTMLTAWCSVFPLYPKAPNSGSVWKGQFPFLSLTVPSLPLGSTPLTEGMKTNPQHGAGEMAQWLEHWSFFYRT